MAVQAQYPSNLLLFNRDEQERKEMDYSSPPTPLPLPQQPLPPSHAFLDHPSPLFFANGAANNNNNNNNNQRKRARDQSTATATATVFQMVPTPQMNLFSPSMNIQSPAIVNLAQLQHQHHPSVVSTGLRLSNFDDDNNNNPSQLLHTHNQSNLYVQQDQLASLINQHKDEIEHLLIAQGEQLRRTLADRQQTHYRALLAAAEETAARRLREKELELNRAVRRAAELEDRIARLRTESLTWQAKAMADQATAANLHAQIQQATMAAAAANSRRSEECCGESGAEDAESAHVDPNRVEEPRRRACRVCHVSDVSVVLLPCRHLCLCYECDAAVRDADAVRCPVCHAVRTGSIQALLS